MNTQKIFLGTNRFILNNSDITNDHVVNFKLVNELKQIIFNGSAVFTDNSWNVDVPIDANTKGSSMRGFWTATKDGKVVTIKDYCVNVELENDELTVELVSPEYFKERVVNISLRDDIKQAFLNTPDEAIRSMLKSGTGQIQTKIETKLYPHEIVDETHDFYSEEFKFSYWCMQLLETPIIEVKKYRLMINDLTVMEVEAKDLIVDKEMGTVQFRPLAFEGNTSVANNYYTGLQAFSQLAGGMIDFSTIPSVFHVDYTAGIDWLNIPSEDREDFKMAISRRAMIEHLPRLDPTVYQQSNSKMIDGASISKSFTGFQHIQTLIAEELKWIDDTKRKYGKHFKIHVG